MLSNIINTYLWEGLFVYAFNKKGFNDACICHFSHFSRVWLFATIWTVGLQALLSMGFSGKNTGMSCHALLQGIFPTQGLNLCPLCRLHWQAGSLLLAPSGNRPATGLFGYYSLSQVPAFTHKRKFPLLVLWSCLWSIMVHISWIAISLAIPK